MTTLTYTDHRYDDRYEIELAPNGAFLCAVRFGSGISLLDAIVYDRLTDIPQPQQDRIQQKIWEAINLKRMK